MKKRVLDYVLTYISVNMKKYNFKTKVSYKKMKKFELRYEKKIPMQFYRNLFQDRALKK